MSALFDDLATPSKAERKSLLMRQKFGPGPVGAKCGTCEHFTRLGMRGYAKCRLYGVTHGTATDWSSRFLACGQFRRPA